MITAAVVAMAQQPSRRDWRNVAIDAYVHTVYSMYQDLRGMVWIGTSQGLFRYDGYASRFVGEDVTLAGSQFYGMIERGDTLYCGTNNGMLMLDIATGRYLPLSGDFPTEIRSMALDGEYIWIGSLNGLYRYPIGSERVERIATGLPHQAVYALLRSREGDIYVGTYDGLCRYDRHEGRFRLIEAVPGGNAAGNFFVNSLVEDERRRCIWIGTEGALLCYDKATQRIVGRRELAQNSVKSLAIDPDGVILAGTDAGLYILDGESRELARHDSRQAGSIANNVVWSVMVDRAGNYWAGTEQDFSVSCNNSGFSIVPLSEITGRGDGNRVYNMLRDAGGALWIGGSNGIIRYDGDATATRWYMSGDERNPLSHNRVRDIYEDGDGNIWIATDGGVNRYDALSRQWVNHRVTDSTHRLNANWAYSIFEDERRRLWIGSYLGGILIADRDRLAASKGVYEADDELNTADSMPNNFINRMKIDRNGNKWVLFFRDSSIIRIDHADGEVMRIDMKAAVGEFPAFLVCDSDDGVWCGFAGGIVRVKTDGTVCSPVKFPMHSGKNLLAMAQVGGEIWVSTDDGVWAADCRTRRLSLLPLPAKMYTCIYYDHRRQRVLLGTVDEYVVVNPDLSSADSNSVGISITGLSVNNEHREVSHDIDRLRLAHDENNIEIRFSDLSYALDNRKHYEYRLAGYEREWIMLAENDNSISLANIPSGDYTLELRQAKGDDDNRFVRRIDIEISSPWYASWWAITAYIAIGVIVTMFVELFLRRRRREQSERMERERVLESVRQRMDFLTGVSHEFKTPLSMIIGPLSKLIAESRDGKLRRTLDLVYANAMKLNSLVHSALEINRIEDNPDKLLIYSRVNIVEFCRSIFDSYRESFPSKHFIFTSSTDRIITEADVVKMESVINNLLSNACKYSSDDSTIAVAVASDGNRLLVTVSDDGVGIPEEECQLIFHRLFRSSRTADDREGTGIGLYLVKQYVEMHSGTIEVESKEGEGTAFRVIIPLREPGADEGVPIDDVEAEDDRRRILIVDDNMAIASFIKEILQEEYRCHIASNGRAALAVCAGVIPDLIIADEMMPVMSGLEMCRRLKSNPRTATIPIILLTAKDDAATEAESVRVGVDTFMPKPFETPMLQMQVRRLMEAKDTMRADVRMEQLVAPRPVEAESAAERQLAQVAQIIEDNIADADLNVGFVCEKSGMQSKQLYRLIKKYVGVSPVEHIKLIRLRKAAMLLEQHKFSVSEVMYMVGFSSSSYFSKCFQAQYGCTPRQYAERQ